MTKLNTEEKKIMSMLVSGSLTATPTSTHIYIVHSTVGLLNSTRKSHNPAPSLREKRELGKMKGGVPSFQLSTDTYSTVWEETLCAFSSRLMNVIT